MTDESPMLQFGFAEALQSALGDSFVRMLPEFVQNGKICGAPENAILLLWPNVARGIISLIETTPEGSNEFVSAWPYSPSVENYRIQVNRLHNDCDQPLLVILDCSHDGVVFSVFDTFCKSSELKVQAGDLVEMTIHGWAVMMEVAPCLPIYLDRGEMNEEMRLQFADSFDEEGRVRIETSEMAAILPHGESVSPFHEIHGVISEIGPELTLGDSTLRRLTITVARPINGGTESALTVDITLSDKVRKGEWPSVGETVQGIVWLQASLKQVIIA